MTVDRRVRLELLQGPEANVTEAIVSVTRGEVDLWREVADVRPGLQMEDAMATLVALHEHADWNAALVRRGIEDTSLVQIDPWPAGTFGVAHEESRRIFRCSGLPARLDRRQRLRPSRSKASWPTSTGDGARCSRCVDLGVVPFPPQGGSYYPEDNGPLRTDLRPLDITQPEGPSFTVEGNLVRWQKWSMRVGMDPLEGLVLHTVGYEDGGRRPPARSTGPR